MGEGGEKRGGRRERVSGGSERCIREREKGGERNKRRVKMKNEIQKNANKGGRR